MSRKRFELPDKLRGESLVRKGLLRSYAGRSEIRLLPGLSVVKVGGHGIIDYGKNVVMPVVHEIGELSKKNQILAVTGGGVRVRHMLDVGLDLGMPTGVLAELTSKVSEQNAIMLSILLSPWHAVRIHTGDLLELPTLFFMGALPVMHGTPPYGLYEYPPQVGSIPPHRTDTGAFLAAEVLGAKNCILVKNVDGLYTENPFKNRDADLIPEISAGELMEMDMEDMVLEPKVVELLQYARHVKEVRIVNGHKPATIGMAIAGENPGTVIKAE